MKKSIELHNSVTIVSSSEGFFTKGMEKKIHELGYSTNFATLENNCMDLKMFRAKTDLYVLYLQDEIGTEDLDSFRDILSIDSKQVIVIGESEDYKQIQQLLPERVIYQWLDRPLDMNAFTACVKGFYVVDTEEKVKKTILIVDDDITYMRLVHDWLKDSYQVGMANSGVQAISWLVKNTADLVLMDYEMPIVSGPQVFEMLKSDSITGTIPVMFLTGKASKDIVMEVMDLKPVDYLLKTIDRQTLLSKLDRFFRSRERGKSKM